MLILDTNYISELGRGTADAAMLQQRLSAMAEEKTTTIISAEEILRGRLAQTAKARTAARQIAAYARLHQTIDDLNNWRILPFDQTASAFFDDLRDLRLGIGTMDLRIASIALANDATLLSRNLRDFERIPNLTVEDWLQ